MEDEPEEQVGEEEDEEREEVVEEEDEAGPSAPP